MFAKLTRSLIAFGVVFVAYQAYALMLAPMIDPPRTTQVGGNAGAIVTVSPVAKYQQLLSAYFPAGHWSLAGKPKVIESGQVMMIVDDYVRDNTGRVNLTKCAVLVFPTPRRPGAAAPRDAVVIEAPQGAKLQFDRNFNPSRGSIGNLVQGHLPGQITIRSDMQDPGPADDLEITTSDLQMNETRIVSLGVVSFRLGKNRGGGEHMEIFLLEEEFKKPGASGFGFNGVKYLEILKSVRLELQVDKLNLSEETVAHATQPRRVQLTAASVPTPKSGAGVWAGAGQQPSVYAAPRTATRQPVATPSPPLEVVCKGSFQLNFLDFTATFNKDVLATQLSLTGQSDQLTCEQLAIRFSDESLSPQTSPDLAEEQRSALSDLKPTLLEATGEPVNMNSPSRGARARARRLRIELESRDLTLDGGSPYLMQGGNELRAPVIRYRHPSKDDPAPIGRLWLAGPGQMRVVPKAENPQEVIEAHWNAVPGMEFPVQLNRESGQPVLMVEGRPQIISSRVGRITSDRLRVAFREVAPDGKEGPAIEVGSGERLALMPERINAIGAVQLESPELSGKTNELVVWIRPEDNSLELSAPNSEAAGFAGGGSGTTSVRTPQKTYHLVSQKMQLDLLLQGRRAKPANLICQGAVRFTEDAPQGSAQTPLSVEGARLKVSDLESGSIKVRVDGADNQNDAAALAEIVAQGLTLQATTVNLDQAANRMWADGAGNARVSVDRDLFGQTTNAAQALHLKWRGGLNFDGRAITVKQDVLGEGPHDWVRCQQVTATLSRPINFVNSRGSSRNIEIAKIECEGGVTLDHRAVDAGGQTSHEHGTLASLSIDRSTGDISGQGPGWIRSVRLENAGGPLTLSTPGAAPAKPSGKGLQFLRVKFLRGVTGNILEGRRQVSFHGNVESVFGPVLEWEQELPMLHPRGLPPDTGTLKCDQLTVNEDPLARFTGSAQPTEGLGPIELRATGSVEIQGAAKDKGQFTAYAKSASYSKAKEEFILEGDTQSPAKLYQQDQPGGQPKVFQAGALHYWRRTGKVAINDFSHGSSGPLDSAQRPGMPQRPSVR
ncbi:hypothetical protein Pla123a_35870 [Posidoniimonas polymericola]|uniref:OstA-like protein n=1 Tax=Posidoniimonas polymericola TaxID=2528002 RepID=A0A5C5YF49_9BACT|nr:hypothetical protein [Posidoniimonas polymericola]TWT73694.1 hypothetical protein Pla123a_35870 [Posidoniimonas polymericola]